MGRGLNGACDDAFAKECEYVIVTSFEDSRSPIQMLDVIVFMIRGAVPIHLPARARSESDVNMEFAQ